MSSVGIRQKLITAARLNPQGGQAYCTGAKRILGLIAPDSATDRWLFSTRGLWRTAASRVAATVDCGAVSSFTPVALDNGNKLPPHFENMLLASLVRGGVTP